MSAATQRIKRLQGQLTSSPTAGAIDYDAVKAKYKASVHGPACTMWYTGTVAEVHEDGTVDVRYEDGDYEAHVRREYVKPLKLALPAGMSEAAD